MKEKIIDKVLSIPYDYWRNGETMLNGIKIEFQQSTGAQDVWFLVEGVELGSPKIKAYYYGLGDFIRKQAEESHNDKLKEIYIKLCV